MLVVEKEKVYNKEDYVKHGKPLRKDKTYKKLKEFKKETLKNQREKNKEKKLGALKTLGVLFIVGMIVVVRYSIIYKNENSIRKIKYDINQVRYKNDDLKIHLMKFKDIKDVDNVARDKFKMVEPNISNTYYYDLSKNNFESEEDKKAENKGVRSIIKKIKNILF